MNVHVLQHVPFEGLGSIAAWLEARGARVTTTQFFADPSIWQIHYNRARPHSRLGPGLPQRPPGLPAALVAGHDLPREMQVVARPILGGLHHEYGLTRLAA